VNDNTECVSRTTDYLACRFPNRTISITRHFRDMEEGWPGGFARREEEDQAYLARHPLPDGTLQLEAFQVHGREVTYHGQQAVALRTNAAGELIAFAGANCQGITIDGRSWEFADQPLALIAWTPVAPERRVPDGAVFQMAVHGQGAVRIPLADLPRNLRVVAEGATPGSRGHDVASRVEQDTLVLDIQPADSGRWLWGVPGSE
jgi:hypothetical protein